MSASVVGNNVVANPQQGGNTVDNNFDGRPIQNVNHIHPQAQDKHNISKAHP